MQKDEKDGYEVNRLVRSDLANFTNISSFFGKPYSTQSEENLKETDLRSMGVIN